MVVGNGRQKYEGCGDPDEEILGLNVSHSIEQMKNASPKADLTIRPSESAVWIETDRRFISS